jgi:signal transduction histidine kinase
MSALVVATVLGALWWQVQLGPIAGLLGLAATYMLWSWRRMDTAVRYLVTEYRRQRASGVTHVSPPRRRAGGDLLDRRIEALTGVTQQLRDLHRFVRDSLNGLPDATLVCDRRLQVLLANAAAVRHLAVRTPQDLQDRPVADLLAGIVDRDGLDPGIAALLLQAGPAPGGIEAQDRQGRDLLVKWAPSFSASGGHSGWILSLVDVTRLRVEQRERDDAMHFLSHDMRAPQSAILTLLDLVRQDPEAMSAAQFQERVERHARKALTLSDDFINLVRAQSREYRLEPQDLGGLLAEVLDDAWEKAQAKRIRLHFDPPPWPADSWVDRELMSRALGNLVGNALKFSPEGSEIRCSLAERGGQWEIAIQDQGPGIALAAQADLFRPFYRVRQRQRTEGTGLGLPFVKTVAVRHGGEVTLHSDSGQGCRFALLLPRASEADTTDVGGGADNPAP